MQADCAVFVGDAWFEKDQMYALNVHRYISRTWAELDTTLQCCHRLEQHTISKYGTNLSYDMVWNDQPECSLELMGNVTHILMQQGVYGGESYEANEDPWAELYTQARRHARTHARMLNRVHGLSYTPTHAHTHAQQSGHKREAAMERITIINKLFC